MIHNYLYKAYLVGFFLLLCFSAKANANVTYTKGGRVTEVKQNWHFNSNHEFVRTEDTVVITLIGGRNDGQMYEIETKDVYELNTLVEVHIDDNGTENCFQDDKVLEVRKIGGNK